MQKEKFDITGMTCSACSARVEACVKKLGGVKEVSVNLLKNTMSLSYDEKQLSVDDIVKSVEKAGYGAFPKSKVKSEEKQGSAQSHYAEMKKRLLGSLIFTVPLL